MSNKITHSQARILALLVEVGQIVETSNGRRVISKNVHGVSVRVLNRLELMGLVASTYDNAGGFNHTRWTATDAGRAAVFADAIEASTATTKPAIANVDADLVRSYLAAIDSGNAQAQYDAEEQLRAALCHDCTPHVPCLKHVCAVSERALRRGHVALVAAELHETPGEIDMAGPMSYSDTKICRRCQSAARAKRKKAPTWTCRACGASCCEHLCGYKSADRFATCGSCATNAQSTARYFGAEAQANPETGLDDYRDDIAKRYGFTTWDAMPPDIQREARKLYLDGRKAERAITKR